MPRSSVCLVKFHLEPRNVAAPAEQVGHCFLQVKSGAILNLASQMLQHDINMFSEGVIIYLLTSSHEVPVQQKHSYSQAGNAEIDSGPPKEYRRSGAKIR